MSKDREIVVVAEEACGWPNLTRLPGGEVLCTYFNAPSHGLEEGDLACAASADGGRSWEPRGVAASHPEGGNRMHLAVGLAGNGDLLAFSSGFFVKDEKFTGFAGQWLSRSADGGRTWKVDEKPVVPDPCSDAIPFGRVLPLSDGRLAYSCYRSQGKGNPSKSWIGFSEDDGANWTKFAQFGEDEVQVLRNILLPSSHPSPVRSAIGWALVDVDPRVRPSAPPPLGRYPRQVPPHVIPGVVVCSASSGPVGIEEPGFEPVQ